MRCWSGRKLVAELKGAAPALDVEQVALPQRLVVRHRGDRRRDQIVREAGVARDRARADAVRLRVIRNERLDLVEQRRQLRRRNGLVSVAVYPLFWVIRYSGSSELALGRPKLCPLSM